MNVKRWSWVTGFLAVWTGGCLAASGGVIQFRGSIVEPGCEAAVSGVSAIELKGCP